MNQTHEKGYHLTNIEKTLDKLNTQKREHLVFLNDNTDSESKVKELWGKLELKN